MSDVPAALPGLPKRHLKGFKYRLYPTSEQARILNQYLGAARHVYNRLLSDAIDVYKNHKENPSLPKPDVSSYSLANVVKNLKTHTDTPWLGAIPSVILQQKAMDLGTAFTNFFKGHNKAQGYPKFKKRGYNDSFRIVGDGSIRVSDDGVVIPKTKDPIHVRWSRDLPSTPSSYTITRTSTGLYFISLVCEYIPNRPSGLGKVGIDLGIKNTAYLSTGESIPNPKPYIAAQKYLAHLQRQLSRCRLGSINFHKIRLKVAKIHEYIKNYRRDFLHKLTSRLIDENQAICIESLNVAGMTKNRRLAKHILDAGFSMFRHLLNYKALESSNTKLYVANTWYPSTQTCSQCGGYPSTKIRLGILKWTCEYCGATHHRDFNASKNLENLIDHANSIMPMDPNVKIVLVPKFSI